MSATKSSSTKPKTRITRVGSGRTKGSFSFVRVPLQSLRKHLGKNASVMVSRKWANGVGIKRKSALANELYGNV